MNTAEIQIQRTNNSEQGAFFVENPEGGEPRYWAEMTYLWQGGQMVINHTGVREMLQGRGVARKLVMAAVDAARAEDFVIVPVCSYAKKVLEGDSAYEDVLA